MNPSLALATVVVDELVRHGITDVVLAPGSRSAPFAYAVERADREGRLRLHVRIDERSAGYLALGLAKVSRVPVPVFTTSGTAVANLLPAVLEAWHAQVPLLLMTADRPPELRGVGANQTTEQPRIFGHATRWFDDFGVPEHRADQQGIWRSRIGRAVAESLGLPAGDCGPVHLNFPLRAPLVPTGDDEWPESLEGRPHGEPWLSLRTPMSGRQSVGRGPVISPVPRTLVLLGDLPEPRQAAELSELADAAGWPVMAEPFGDYHRGRVTPHGSLLLRAQEWLAENLPERVLVGGRVTLDRHVAALLRNPAVQVEAVAGGTSWADPGHVVHRVHEWGAIARSHTAVSSCVDRTWSSRWRMAGQVVARTAGPIVEASWPSGMAVARTVVHSLPAGAGLYVGPSNTARDLDLGRNPNVLARDIVAVSNRGLSGIDGVVSSAIGMALSRPGMANAALVGDLTFLHDTNGLTIGPKEPRPDLTIVVINDDGGGIFGVLEPGEGGLTDPFERVFGTPTGLDLGEIARSHGVAHQLIDTADELAELISTGAEGLRVLEVRVGRARQRALLAELSAAVRQALAAE